MKINVRTTSRPNLGVVPVIWALYGGGLAVASGATWWAGSDCDSWWCRGNLERSLFTQPETPARPAIKTGAAAPLTRSQMTIPQAWTPEDLVAWTNQGAKDFQSGVAYQSSNVRQAARGGAPRTPTGDPQLDDTLLMAGLAALGLGVVLFLTR